jgi:hypothetical protein
MEPGCTKGRDTGHALYRTSPKGELFEGKCAEHAPDKVDPIVAAIEYHNQQQRREQ